MAKLKAQNAKPKTRWLRIGLLLVAALWLLFTLIGRVLRPIALNQIAELTNTKIKAESVDFNINGSVIIEHLIIRPDRVPRYDDAILKAKKVYARFGIGSLLLLRPRLKKINVKDFIFNAQYDLDTNRWNVAAIKISAPKAGSGKMPVVHLKRGTLKYTKVSNGRVKVIAAVPLDAKFELAEEPRHGYSFNITTAAGAGRDKSTLTGFWQPSRPRQAGNITIAGGISSADIPALRRTWTIYILAAELTYDRDNLYSLKLRIKDLLSTHKPAYRASAFDRPSSLEKLGPFTALQKFFNRYRPEGLCSIDIDALGDLDRISESALFGKVYCKDISICDRKFPYLIEHLTGEVDFTAKGATLNNLSGCHNDVKLSLNGWSRDFGPNWKYQFQFTSDNMALDSDLYNALSAKQQKFWSDFSPTGLVAINYSRSRQSKTDKQWALAVELLGTEAKYRHFPYPLKNLTGKLMFDRDSIDFLNVLSQSNERKIYISGKVTATSTDRPICDISIKANNVPLDSTLAACLSDKQRQLYNRLNMTGLADADIKVFTPKDDFGPVDFVANVSLKEAFLKADDFPLPISNISAKTVITPDLISVENLIGRHNQSLVSLIGLIWTATETQQPRYHLVLCAEQAQLNDDLFNLLPASLKKAVSKLQPEGNINYHADLKKPAGAESPDYRITVSCLGDSIKLEPLTHPIEDIAGRLTITKNSLKLRDITATIADSAWTTPDASTIKVNGRIAMADSPAGRDQLQITDGDITFTADNLRIKGKSLTNLKTDVYYDPRRKTWLSKNLVADSYDGRLTGKLELKQSAEGTFEYLLQTGFDNIDLKQFLSDTERQRAFPDGYTTGRMDGSLSFAAAVGESLPHIGRCRLQITDMKVGKLSPLAKLLNVLNLTEPKDFAFERMLVDSYIRHNRLFFERFDLSGDSVAFNGSGWMDLQTEDIDLLLTARGRRLATAEPSLLQSLTEGLSPAVVRMEVTGSVYDPKITTRTLPLFRDTLEILGTPR